MRCVLVLLLLLVKLVVNTEAVEICVLGGAAVFISFNESASDGQCRLSGLQDVVMFGKGAEGRL